jgi:hypothetical protein
MVDWGEILCPERSFNGTVWLHRRCVPRDTSTANFGAALRASVDEEPDANKAQRLRSIAGIIWDEAC